MGAHWLDAAIFVALCLLAWALTTLIVRLSHHVQDEERPALAVQESEDSCTYREEDR